MAEAVVGALIGKFGAALANEAAAYGSSFFWKEASALKGFFGEIRKAEVELESMRAYLRDSEKFKDVDETTSIFVNKIRDVVDEFMYKLQDNKHGGFAAKMKKRIKHVKVWHRLALKLHDINAELEDTTRRRDRYVIPGMQRYSGSGDHHTRSTNPILCSAREEDLIGITDHAAMLKWWLIGDLDETTRKITAIWGMGGVGKTTLVDHVYRVVKKEFDTSAWVIVSKTYQIEDLLKKIAIKFGISIDSTNMDMRRLVDVIRNHLEGKRFLLVLDDVWEQDVWINSIMPVFLTNCTSRFVITSRLSEVASLATSNCSIELKPLQEYHSYMLFSKLAFSNNDEKACPLELWDLAEKFLKRCEGLPIAIACIGRLLSCKAPTHSEWENVYEKLELQSTKNVIPGVDTVLKLSLEDLPYELKNCFLYCAMFPEYYSLKRRMILRHWITAGFIKDKENNTLEQVAEDFLNDLVNRSLLQVTQKNEFGRVKSFRIHGILRHLALDKAEKECFGKVYEGSGTFSVDGARRLSIQTTSVATLSQFSVTHLRAIHAYMRCIDIDLLAHILHSSKMLSTLDLQGTQITLLPNEVFNLFNLRLLGLRYTGVINLPEALGRLQNLEVLDVRVTALLSLPKDVAKLKKLRYLYTGAMPIGTSLVGTKIPRGIRNLTGLHALKRIKASLEIICDVAVLTELRTFAVSDLTSEHSLKFCSAVGKMNHLVNLSIAASNENEVLPWEALRLPETLSKLKLEGQLEKKQMPQIISTWSQLNNLTHLTLKGSKLDEDPFASLVSLRDLCFLRLVNAYNGKKLYISALPKLRKLELGGAPQLNQVEIAEDALGNLVELELSYCPELKRVPHGVRFLSALEELHLVDAADEFIEMLQQEPEANECKEELMKISHITKVIVESTERNFWQRIVFTNKNKFSG